MKQTLSSFMIIALLAGAFPGASLAQRLPADIPRPNDLPANHPLRMAIDQLNSMVIDPTSPSGTRTFLSTLTPTLLGERIRAINATLASDFPLSVRDEDGLKNARKAIEEELRSRPVTPPAAPNLPANATTRAVVGDKAIDNKMDDISAKIDRLATMPLGAARDSYSNAIGSLLIDIPEAGLSTGQLQRLNGLITRLSSQDPNFLERNRDFIAIIGGTSALGAALRLIRRPPPSTPALVTNNYLNNPIIQTENVNINNPKAGPSSASAISRPVTPLPAPSARPRFVVPRLVGMRSVIPVVAFASLLTGPFKALFTEGLTVPEYQTVSAYRSKVKILNDKGSYLNSLVQQVNIYANVLSNPLVTGDYRARLLAAQETLLKDLEKTKKEYSDLEKEVNDLEKKVEKINDLYEREAWDAAHPTA